jgi:hypothetical protein
MAKPLRLDDGFGGTVRLVLRKGHGEGSRGGKILGHTRPMKKARPAAFPGVSVVRMSKAEAAMGIVSFDASMLSGFTALSPPEVVPGTVMQDENGDIIRGVFRVGPYQAEYVRLRSKLPYCTIAGPMPVPFTMIVNSWADAQTKVLRACDAFQKGLAAPDEGVFQHIGSRVAVKWPGVSK